MLRLLVLLFLAVPLDLRAGGDGSRLYEIRAETMFYDGCFPPCRCLIFVTDGVSGTFRLTLEEDHPLFRIYAVSDVDWTVPQGSQAPLRVTGSGHYRVGGEVAAMHQLQLDLVVGDRPVQHFDSGLVIGGASFPAIDIDIAVNGRVCRDTAFDVEAKPVSEQFARGDCTGDAAYNITDPIRLLLFLFAGGAQLECRDACDADDDGGLHLTDAIFMLHSLFLEGPLPPAPHPDCGGDPTQGAPDELECTSFPPCP